MLAGRIGGQPLLFRPSLPGGQEAPADSRPAAGRGSEVFRTAAPEHPFDLILARPTRTSATVSVMTSSDLEGFIEYGSVTDTVHRRTATATFAAGKPQEIVLDNLAPDEAISYRFLHRPSGRDENAGFEAAAWNTFHTPRARGHGFTFTIQADSHLDTETNPDVYVRTLQNVAADQGDFHIDLGDTFMTDKRRANFRATLPQYLAQRWYFGLVAASSPLFLVLGNHDGEAGWLDRGQAGDMAHWSNAQRKLYFPGPEPSAFYTGSATVDPVNGLLQNYCAFTWGDALCVVLDPFWNTRRHRGRIDDRWAWTLGDVQYRWLAQTVAASRARFKFVFIHHLVGGLDSEARGGAEAAPFGEWGGNDPDGTPAFARERPGWEAPIETLLRRAGVQAVFHGHDHFYAMQPRENVVYQLVPQPGHTGGDTQRMAAEYGYVSGTILSAPGHLRVKVEPAAATVEFVRTSTVSAKVNGRVVHRYTLPAGPEK